jgi:hypothetical protein
VRTQSLRKDTDDTKKEIHSKTETTQCKFQKLKPKLAVGLTGEQTPTYLIGATQSPRFDEPTSWAMAQQQFQTVAEHSDWTLCD